VNGIEPHLPALQVVVPMLSAAVVMLLRPRGLAWAASTLTSLFAFAIAITLAQETLSGGTWHYAMGDWPAPYGIELKVDSLSALMLLVVTGSSSIALLAGYESLSREIEQDRQPLFYTAWLLVLAGLCGILVAADAFNIFVFMEISSLAGYVLVAGGPDRRALPAVFKYLVMGTVGATFYLIGVGLIYLMTGTLNLADMAIRIHHVADQKPILVAAGFITIGLALKAAVFPLHVWLPNAYRFAPNMATVFLAACSTKVSIYILLRFDFFVLQPNLEGHIIQFGNFLMPLSILGILVASAVALFEGHLKRLLAWSSIAQIGYIILGASLVSVAGLNASILHIFNHALAKSALFLSVAALGMTLTKLHIENISGIAKTMPWTMAAFVIAGFSLIGIPGTAGFISKWYLITAVAQEGTLGIVLIGLILISSLMALVYIWRIIEPAYFGKPAEDITTLREAPLPILAGTWLLALGNIYFGLFPGIPIELSRSAAFLLIGNAP
jgi:multicomponent Na+:H+ antiporter subunit D